MSTITTEDELTALPEGAVIQVDDNGVQRTWRREGERFANDAGNATVPPDFFAGFLAQEAVRMAPPHAPQPGDWFTSDRFTYFAYGRAGERMRCVVYRNEAIYTTSTEYVDTLAGMRYQRTAPGYAERDASLLNLLIERDRAVTEQAEEVERLRQQVERLNNRVAPTPEPVIPPGLIESLHTYADEEGNSEFESILQQHGIGRQVDIDANVRVYGHGILSESEMCRGMGWNDNDVNASMDDNVVNFTVEFTVSVSGHPGECVCERVDDDFLDGNTNIPRNIEHWEVDSVSCDNC